MNHPHLTELFKIYQTEWQPFRKVHRMIDLFESIIKSHTVVIIAEYVKHNKLSKAAKGMLAQGLRTPSLGTWQLFSRILSEELNTDGYAWTFTGFPEDFASLDKALNVAKTNVISFRNGYAHGATPTDEQCESDIRQFEPFLIQLLDSHWLSNTTLENRENKVWIVSDNGELCLHPIFLSKDEGGSSPYAFFNDLKNDKVGLLNYPLSKHYREKQFYQEFHQYLPLNEWKKSGNNEFYQRIEELTETFKGRTQERARLLDFVCNNSKGYFSIQGNPGIGKSALIAQFFKDLKSHKDTQQLQVVEYFIRRGTAQAQVEYVFNYLLRRTDELFPAGKEIRAEGKAVWDLQQQLFSKWRLWGEQSKGDKLLFLIDGLDEGVENSVVTYLPRENFEGILIIYGSRPGGHKSIDDLWGQLPVEHHTKLELSGLGKEDIRALIYEVANKYELDRDSAWIDAVQRRSEGNPLYLKLLCDAMEHGSIVVNDIGALPEKIDEYYKAILDRYSRDADGDALLSGLFTFAAARDYLTMTHLGLINKLGEATVQRIGSTLKEVLYENPLTEEVLDYQLFHESFREYLVKEKGSSVREAAERIIDFCEGWKELEGTWEQRYALEHYAAHLSESKKEVRVETLSRLIYDHGYTSTQKKVLKGFDASNEMYRIALKKSCELKREDDMLEAALCLVDLKYEEANDAPQIVAMVANCDIDLALKRIESFGGADAEGMKRKFILYMLCLMELTLLDSKDKPFCRTAIEKLLNHLDEELPTDHSILNWDNFFPSYLMFQMACIWVKMGLDYICVYKRTDSWQSNWIPEKGPYSELQFQIMIECARDISYDYKKILALIAISTELVKQDKVEEGSSIIQESHACARGVSDYKYKSPALREISIELAKQGKLEESLECVLDIHDDSYKSNALSAISTELAKQGKLEKSLACALDIHDDWEKSRALSFISTELAKQGKLEESLACSRGIIDKEEKSKALSSISTELAKQGKLGEAESVMMESLAFARGVNDEKKNNALVAISTELAKQGKLEESLPCALSISNDWNKSNALRAISSELAKQGKLEESLACARGISDDWKKILALSSISTELVKQGKIDEGSFLIQESLACARGISDEEEKSNFLEAISTELARQGKLEECSSVIQESLACARGISDESVKSNALRVISTELAKHGKLEESLACARGISKRGLKSDALNAISSELAKKCKIEEGSSIIQESLACARGISDDRFKSPALREISTELVKQGKLEESLACARSISHDWYKSNALRAISSELAKQGKLEESLACARGISYDYEKILALIAISTVLVKQSKIDDGSSIIQESLACARGISDEDEKSKALRFISTELAKLGKLEEGSSVMMESLVSARGISDDWKKILALSSISTELVKQGKLAEGSSVILESLECERDISDCWYKSPALREISTELVKQGKLEESLACARGISDESIKSDALREISTELVKQGKLEESLACAQGVSDDWEKSRALSFISTELAKQGNWQLAEKIYLEIPNIAKRQECCKEIAKSEKNDNSLQIALDKHSLLQNDEARLFYLKGCAESININDIDTFTLKDSLPFFIGDSASIEKLLQAYSQHEIFFNKPSKEKINRLNKTLNIQWALDIIANFPKEEIIVRALSNLPDWIDQIPDEDDRDQISLWAKQVAKGKISESEFNEKVKSIN